MWSSICDVFEEPVDLEKEETENKKKKNSDKEE